MATKDSATPAPPGADKTATDAAAECAASQHLWALPEKNPFNSSLLDCSFACRRCGAAAKFSIAVGK